MCPDPTLRTEGEYPGEHLQAWEKATGVSLSLGRQAAEDGRYQLPSGSNSGGLVVTRPAGDGDDPIADETLAAIRVAFFKVQRPADSRKQERAKALRTTLRVVEIVTLLSAGVAIVCALYLATH